MRIVLFGLILAAVVYFVSNGQVLFLPLLILLPLTLMRGGRRRDRSMSPFGVFTGGRRRAHRWP